MNRRTFTKRGAAAAGLPALAGTAAAQKKPALRIYVSSVMVDDQEKALKFYTGKLGFVKKNEVPLGAYKWLTVVSPDEPSGVELLLEPTGFPASKVYQKALYDAGIPLTAFAVADIQKEYERLKGLGVAFKGPPVKAGPVTIAILDDTCGNRIQLVQF